MTDAPQAPAGTSKAPKKETDKASASSADESPGTPAGAKPGPKDPPGKTGDQKHKNDAPAGKAPPPQPPSRGEVVAKLRRERARKLGLRFALVVLLPTLLAAVYYGLIASKQYESYSVFTVHSAEQRPMVGLEGLLGTTVGSPATRDTLAIRDFVLSRDMLSRLDEEHGFIAHYQDSGVDYVSRMSSDASFEDAHAYYLTKVHVEFDSTSGSLSLRVRAFSAEKAQEFAMAITEYSEGKVNTLSKRERRDQTRYARQEVERCEERLIKARQKLLEEQQKHAELNPLETAGAAMSVRTQLEVELAKARAELSSARAFMTPSAPKVQELEARVRALSGQVEAEKNRLVDPENEDGIAESLAQFETVMIEKEFAQKSYQSAMAALELARAEAARQHRYLAVIATPFAPDESTYPQRALSVVTVFVLSFLLLGIGSLLVAAVREHARL